MQGRDSNERKEGGWSSAAVSDLDAWASAAADALLAGRGGGLRERLGEFESDRILKATRAGSGCSPCEEKAARILRWERAQTLQKAAAVAGAEDGVMVAWYPPRDVAERMAVPGGVAAEDLHMTLAYLGKVGEQEYAMAELVAAVEAGVDLWDTLEVEVSGVARWTGAEGGDGDPFVLLLNSPDLVRLHGEIRDALEEIDVEVASDYAFVPHLTLTYLEDSEEAPIVRATRETLEIGEVAVVVAGERVFVPLDGASQLEQIGDSASESERLAKSAKNVGPRARWKLRHLINHYAKKRHPFRTCVRDNRKRFGPSAERICAVVKDLAEGQRRGLPYYTGWRKGGKKKRG